MNQIITRLQGKNILVILLILLTLSILISLLNIWLGALLGGIDKVLSLILVLIGFLFHCTIASKAILEEDITVKVLKIFLVGGVWSFVINSMLIFPSISMMLAWRETLFGVVSFVPSLFYLGGYVFGLKSLKDDYKIVWYLAIAWLGLSVFSGFSIYILRTSLLGGIASIAGFVVLIIMMIKVSKCQKQERIVAANRSINNNFSLVSPSDSSVSDTIMAINRLKAVYDSGGLTEEEYNALKKKLINL